MVEGLIVGNKRECLTCLLWFCCVLLTMSSFTFSMYTVKEFATLKARINQLEVQLNLIHDNMDNPIEDSVEDSRSLVLHPRKERKKDAKKNTFLEKNSTKISKEPTKKYVFIHLNGGQNDNGANVTDRKLIKHWKVSQSSEHVVYNVNDGSIEVTVPGYYYIYSQIQLMYKKWENQITSHETFVNYKRVLSSMFGNKSKKRANGAKFDSNYQGGVFKLQNGDRIFVRGRNKRGWIKQEANYFGTFLLAPLS